MGFHDFLERWFPTKQRVGGDTIIIDVPASVYYKELALYTGISLIANAIARSEIKTYLGDQEVKERDYYLLNFAPNVNQSSSQFWHKVMNRLIRDGTALAFEWNGGLFCADSYAVESQSNIMGNVYSGITIDQDVVPQKMKANDVYLFHMNCVSIQAMIDGLYDEYGKMLQGAIQAFRRGNGQKYKLHISGAKAGDDEFNKEFEEVIKKQLQAYMDNDNAVYPEFDGYSLEPGNKDSVKSADDVIKLRKEIFSIVGDALKIPSSLMSGNMTNMTEIAKMFLTFSVDPYGDMIEEVLNKRGGYENWKAGNRYEVDTSTIYHKDLFDVAAAIGTIIGSGVMNVDEMRTRIGEDELNTEWSRQYWMTKNFSKIEDLLMGGGEKESEK